VWVKLTSGILVEEEEEEGGGGGGGGGGCLLSPSLLPLTVSDSPCS